MGLPADLIHDPVLTPSTTTIRDAARRMGEEGIGSLIVTRPEGGLGLVTDRDLALAALCNGLEGGASVDHCASPRVATARTSESPFDVARTLARHGVSRAPVLDQDGALIGIVSSDDLVWYFAQELRWLADAIRTGFENEANPPAPAGSIFGRE